MTVGRDFDVGARSPATHAGTRSGATTLDVPAADSLRRAPARTALVTHRAGSQARRFTYAEFGNKVLRAAAELRALGVSRTDIVSIQLSNWWEFAIAALACRRIGAAVNPLLPIFRERELRYMPAFSEARVLIVPRMFRRFDHKAMAQRLKPERPRLAHVIVVDGEGANAFDSALLGGRARVQPAEGAAMTAAGAEHLSVLMFTSGITGEPKGAIHSNHSLVVSIDALAGGAPRPPRLCTFVCVGAPIPPVLIERAARKMDLSVSSQWGMTEALACTLVEPARARGNFVHRVPDLRGHRDPPRQCGRLYPHQRAHQGLADPWRRKHPQAFGDT
ncbi:MAG: AMP-binding protein [Rhodoferax sp.]|nr:AMP-binding protein [Rhodoferax sp.]